MGCTFRSGSRKKTEAERALVEDGRLVKSAAGKRKTVPEERRFFVEKLIFLPLGQVKINRTAKKEALRVILMIRPPSVAEMISAIIYEGPSGGGGGGGSRRPSTSLPDKQTESDHGVNKAAEPPKVVWRPPFHKSSTYKFSFILHYPPTNGIVR